MISPGILLIISPPLLLVGLASLMVWPRLGLRSDRAVVVCDASVTSQASGSGSGLKKENSVGCSYLRREWQDSAAAPYKDDAATPPLHLRV